MKKDFDGLNQAEDRDVEIEITLEGEPLLDVVDAFMEIRTLKDEPVLLVPLNGGVTFANSALTTRLTETDTANMVGKYKYELWFKDSADKDVIAAWGTLKFNATFGRF